MENEQQSSWNSCNDALPPRKEGWSHSEQCLVFYKGQPNKSVDGFGIAYYHYEPPFKEQGMWVDFAHYGRQPTLWMPIEAPATSQND